MAEFSDARFFINWAERLLVLFTLVGFLPVIAKGIATMNQPSGSFSAALGGILGGGVYVLVTTGLMSAVFGIYRNTQETNRLLSRLSQAERP